jgi:hypothetical protein
MRVNPYLMFNGDCEEAFRLFERIAARASLVPSS